MPGRPTIWIIVGQGPTALAVGAGGGCFDIFTLIYPFSPLFPALWQTARYGLKYYLKGPLNPKQPTKIEKKMHLLPSNCRYFDKTFIEMFLVKSCFSHIYLAYCSFVLVATETMMRDNGKR